MMNIPEDIRLKYIQLKNEAEAAHMILRKEPTLVNANRHSTSFSAFKAFCVEAMETLMTASDEPKPDKKSEILANIDKYKTCGQCGTAILHQLSDEDYIASSDFLEDFPGWCYTCLTEYCLTHSCQTCDIAKDPTTCSFKYVKNIKTL
jgi:hypothetical protein